MNLSELTASARLLLVAVLVFRLVANGLAIRNSGLAEQHLDAESLLETIDHDLEMEVAHSRHQCLLGARLEALAEGRILFVQSRQSLGDFLLVALVLGVK